MTTAPHLTARLAALRAADRREFREMDCTDEEAEAYWERHERDFGPYREMLTARAQPAAVLGERRPEEWEEEKRMKVITVYRVMYMPKDAMFSQAFDVEAADVGEALAAFKCEHDGLEVKSIERLSSQVHILTEAA